MKVGKLPVASIILIIVIIAKFGLKLFYPENAVGNSAFITGLIVGSLIVYGLYYLNIYYNAWSNNRKAGRYIQK